MEPKIELNLERQGGEALAASAQPAMPAVGKTKTIQKNSRPAKLESILLYEIADKTQQTFPQNI